MSKNLSNLTAVICCLNEVSRIEKSIDSLTNSNMQIIVVDGGSVDGTTDLIKEKYNHKVKLIQSNSGSLMKDRQIGIDNVCTDYLLMFDADHRAMIDDVISLFNDLFEYNLDIVQSQIAPFSNNSSVLILSEAQSWDLIHNIPGEKEMIGTAPAIYRKSVFETCRFDRLSSKIIDDTEFIYRLKKDTNFKIGIGRTKILQEHKSSITSYLKKFWWYGKGDYEFIKNYPSRSLSHIYHLIVRYPIIYPIKSVLNFKFIAPIYLILNGLVRFSSVIWSIIRRDKF